MVGMSQDTEANPLGLPLVMCENLSTKITEDSNYKLLKILESTVHLSNKQMKDKSVNGRERQFVLIVKCKAFMEESWSGQITILQPSC